MYSKIFHDPSVDIFKQHNMKKQVYSNSNNNNNNNNNGDDDNNNREKSKHL